jgi:hypothetical protein
VDVPGRLHGSSPAELKERFEAERRGTPLLVFRDGGGRQMIYELSPDRSPLTIGRQPASDLEFSWDPEVSRAHATLECVGAVWTLVDDGGSRNGSFVNGERVHGRRALRDGDVIAIGRTTLQFLSPLRGGDSTVGSRRAAPPISPAQRRVLVALCRPFATARFAATPSNRELAIELCLSVETVKFHLHELFELFGLEAVPQHRKRAMLAQAALEQGVVAPRELLAASQG